MSLSPDHPAVSLAKLRQAWLNRGPPETGSCPGPSPEAGVAAIFADHERGVPAVLLIERSTHPSDPWSGHIGLPGGRRERGDADRLSTVLRETREEVGLILLRESLVASLPPIQARSRGTPVDLWVHPLVFVVDRAEPPSVSVEVRASRWVPVREILDPANASVLRMVTGLEVRDHPGVRLGDWTLWGLTLRILTDVLRAGGVPWEPDLGSQR